MPLNDLLKLIAKIFGVYLLFDYVLTLPYRVMRIYYSLSIPLTALDIAELLLLFLLIFILIFRTEKLIQLLRIKRDIDSDVIDFKEKKEHGTLQIVLMIMSIYFIFSGIPNLLTNVFFLFKQSFKVNDFNPNDILPINRVDYYALISSGISIVLGILILTNSFRLSQWLGSKSKKN